jgi:hypothetical protein
LQSSVAGQSVTNQRLSLKATLKNDTRARG